MLRPRALAHKKQARTEKGGSRGEEAKTTAAMPAVLASCFLEALSDLLLDFGGKRADVLLRERSQRLQRQRWDQLLGSEPCQLFIERHRLDSLFKQLLEPREFFDVWLLHLRIAHPLLEPSRRLCPVSRGGG